MTNLRTIVLAAAVAMPLALSAQPIDKPAEPAATATSAPDATTTKQPSSLKRAFRKVGHGLNPATWATYLSKREYCTYAYSQAYGVCEGNTPR